MLKSIGFLPDITGKFSHIDFCRGFIPRPAGFKTFRPAEHTGFTDAETERGLLETQAVPIFYLRNFPTKIY